MRRLLVPLLPNPSALLLGLLGPLAAFLPGLTTPSHAQSSALNVEIVLDETSFLPGEELPVGVRISNLTGRPLTFGTSTNWLTFLIENRKGEVVTRLGNVPVAGEFTLESAKAGLKWWNLQPYFEFDQPGPYLVYAEVRLPEDQTRLISEPAEITLQTSSRLWEITFGVPPPENLTAPSPATPPELRRYSLHSANRLRERKLYARVSDESDTHIFKVVLLDRLLSFSNPQQQLDARSHLHVLFQTGGSTYTYCVINPNGELVVRQRHEILPSSRPRLAKNSDGTITVAGGQRLPSSADIPPYIPPPEPALGSTNNPPTITPATNTPPSTSKKSRDSRNRRSRSNRE